MSDSVQAALSAAGDSSASLRGAAMDILSNKDSSSEEVNLAMLKFNEASAKFNAAIKTAQEEPNTVRRSAQGQQA